MRPTKPTKLQDLHRRSPPPDLKLLRPNKRADLPLMGNLCSPVLTTASYPLSLRTVHVGTEDTLKLLSRSDQPLLDSALRWFSVWKPRGKKYRFQLQTSDLSLCDRFSTCCVFRPASVSPPPPTVWCDHAPTSLPTWLPGSPAATASTRLQ